MKDKLSALPVKTLIAVLKDLKSGNIGFDPFRDERTNTKERLVTFIYCGFNHALVTDAISRVTGKAQQQDAPPQVGFHHGGLHVDLGEYEKKLDAVVAATKGNKKKAVDAAAGADAVGADNVDKIGQQIGALLAKVAGKPAIDEDLVRAIVSEEVRRAKISPQLIEIRQKDRPDVVLKERVNPAFETIVKVASEYPNIMLVGPAGCGKTTLAAQVAKALGKSFASISGSAGITESHFTGRLLPTGAGGKFEYTESPFIKQYAKDDGCFLIDEFDALDPNCLMIIQQAAANNGFHVESRLAGGLDSYVQRGKGSLLIASANTYGTGADCLYVGRYQQDAAASDRWYFIEVDYDTALEESLASAEICDWVWGVREKVKQHKIRRVVSTRMIQKFGAARRAGIPVKAIKESLLAGWTQAERQKVGA